MFLFPQCLHILSLLGPSGKRFLVDLSVAHISIEWGLAPAQRSCPSCLADPSMLNLLSYKETVKGTVRAKNVELKAGYRQDL